MKYDISKFTKEDVKKWQGVRNDTTGDIDGGYLFFWVNKEKGESVGVQVHNVANKKEAINKFFNEQ